MHAVGLAFEAVHAVRSACMDKDMNYMNVTCTLVVCHINSILIMGCSVCGWPNNLVWAIWACNQSLTQVQHFHVAGDCLAHSKQLRQPLLSLSTLGYMPTKLLIMHVIQLR